MMILIMNNDVLGESRGESLFWNIMSLSRFISQWFDFNSNFLFDRPLAYSCIIHSY